MPERSTRRDLHRHFIFSSIQILLTVVLLLAPSMESIPLGGAASNSPNATTPVAFYQDCLAVIQQFPRDAGTSPTDSVNRPFAAQSPPAYSSQYVLPQTFASGNCIIRVELAAFLPTNGGAGWGGGWNQISDSTKSLNEECQQQSCEILTGSVGQAQQLSLQLDHRYVLPMF